MILSLTTSSQILHETFCPVNYAGRWNEALEQCDSPLGEEIFHFTINLSLTTVSLTVQHYHNHFLVTTSLSRTTPINCWGICTKRLCVALCIKCLVSVLCGRCTPSWNKIFNKKIASSTSCSVKQLVWSFEIILLTRRMGQAKKLN